MSGLVEKLKKYDGLTTIDELLHIIKQEEILARQKEDEEVSKVKLEFENTYLKYIDKKSIFGKELSIIELNSLVRKERTTEWNFVYYFTGNKITFSNTFLNYRKFNPKDVNYSFSAEDLKSMIKISKEEYLTYKKEYEKIQSNIKKLINL
jgi:hypothetical protein